eukprot:GHVS01064623.1.p1 GENE.GHVS01064623.1~~GHVS01064623.1.p1  ORF type:complete len:611 (+),score=90.76 GHVS01064623.1:181-2013(+)
MKDSIPPPSLPSHVNPYDLVQPLYFSATVALNDQTTLIPFITADVSVRISPGNPSSSSSWARLLGLRTSPQLVEASDELKECLVKAMTWCLSLHLGYGVRNFIAEYMTTLQRRQAYYLQEHLTEVQQDGSGDGGVGGGAAAVPRGLPVPAPSPTAGRRGPSSRLAKVPANLVPVAAAAPASLNHFIGPPRYPHPRPVRSELAHLSVHVAYPLNFVLLQSYKTVDDFVRTLVPPPPPRHHTSGGVDNAASPPPTPAGFPPNLHAEAAGTPSTATSTHNGHSGTATDAAHPSVSSCSSIGSCPISFPSSAAAPPPQLPRPQPTAPLPPYSPPHSRLSSAWLNSIHLESAKPPFPYGVQPATQRKPEVRALAAEPQVKPSKQAGCGIGRAGRGSGSRSTAVTRQNVSLAATSRSDESSTDGSGCVAVAHPDYAAVLLFDWFRDFRLRGLYICTSDISFMCAGIVETCYHEEHFPFTGHYVRIHSQPQGDEYSCEMFAACSSYQAGTGPAPPSSISGKLTPLVHTFSTTPECHCEAFKLRGYFVELHAAPLERLLSCRMPSRLVPDTLKSEWVQLLAHVASDVEARPMKMAKSASVRGGRGSRAGRKTDGGKGE